MYIYIFLNSTNKILYIRLYFLSFLDKLFNKLHLTSNQNKSFCLPPEKNVKCSYEVFHGHRRFAVAAAAATDAFVVVAAAAANAADAAVDAASVTVDVAVIVVVVVAAAAAAAVVVVVSLSSTGLSNECCALFGLRNLSNGINM